MSRHWNPDRSRERWHALKVPGARKALRAEREAAVVEKRPASLSSSDWLPTPFPRELVGAGRTRPGMIDSQLGLDAGGRPAIQQSDHGARAEAISWGPDWCEVVPLGTGSAPHLRHFNFEDGRLVEEIEIEGGRRLDGELCVGVKRWSYDDLGRPELAVETYEAGGYAARPGAEPGLHWRGKLYRYTYDAEGQLERIMWSNSREGFADGEDVEAAQALARAGEGTLFKEPEPLFDGRTQRIEHDLPPRHLAFVGVAEPLTEAFRRALQPHVAAGDVEFVYVDPNAETPMAVVVSAAAAQRARRMGLDEKAMLALLPRAPEGVTVIEAIDIADLDLLRALRRGNQALGDSWERPSHFELGVDVAARLGAIEWQGQAAPRIVSAPRRRERNLSDMMDDVPSPASTQGPVSRAELRALLLGAGLDEAEARVVEQDARWGLGIHKDGNGASRLGGSPVLSPGTPWPTVDGRPLTHLATIAFDELPAFEDRHRLPARGLLSFFVDLSDEGFMDIAGPGDGRRDLVRFLATPSDGPHESVAPPGPALPERRIRFVPSLQLRPLVFELGEYLLGLDAFAEHAVEQLRERLDAYGHQMLGHPVTIQDDPRDGDQITLLRIGGDDDLAFSFADGGDLHLYGAPGDIAAGRWDQVTVVGDSN